MVTRQERRRLAREAAGADSLEMRRVRRAQADARKLDKLKAWLGGIGL